MSGTAQTPNAITIIKFFAFGGAKMHIDNLIYFYTEGGVESV